MKGFLAMTVAAALWSGSALAGAITLYSEPGFRGDRLTLRGDVGNLDGYGRWNDRARSLMVLSGTWEVCKHAGYRKCRTLGPGTRLANLAGMSYLDAISSLRQVDMPGRWDGHDRDDPWDRDRWEDDRWGDPWGRPLPPPPSPRPLPPPAGGAIIWDDGRGSGPGLSACQQQVYQGFVERFGQRDRANFTGLPDDGSIWWQGQSWRYRCAGGRVNIWQ